MDMDNQYIAFYESLRTMASGESDIFFSWGKAMGTNYIGLFAYYLASPLSWLILLFEDTLTGIFFLTVLKIALCGVTGYLFFRYVFPMKPLPLLIFSTSYALMSYNMVYSLSLMWLDGVILLPLVLLGAERILRGKRAFVFILFLTLTLISQYYIAYMVCLFSALFVLYRYFSQSVKPRKTLKTAGIFAAGYAVSLGLSLWLLLPTAFDLLSSRAEYTNYVPDTLNNFPLFLYPLSFLPGRYTSITNSGLPVLYVGVLAGVLCLLFFFSRGISVRKKLLTFFMFILLLCSFWFTKADILWHGFQHPNWFPYRYAFVYQFFVVFIACSAYDAISRRPKKDGRRGSPSWLKAGFSVLLLLCVCIDLFLNAESLFKGLDREFAYHSAAEYKDFKVENLPALNAIRENDDSFYRVEKTYQRSFNDALALGYNGVTHYSSAFNQNIIQFTKELGFAQNYFWNGYFGSTPVTDSLFSIKYVLSKDTLPYTERMVSDGIIAYENPYALPIGFMVDNPADIALDGTGNYFTRQNEWLRRFSGMEQDVFLQVGEVQALGETQFRFTAQTGGPIYAYFDTNVWSGGSIIVNDSLTIPYFSGDDTHVIYLGQFEQGQEVTLTMDIDAVTNTHIYTLDLDMLEKAVQTLRQSALQNISYQGSHIEAGLTPEKSGTLFLSIPYDKGFSILIDGQKTEYTAFNDTFILLPVESGQHKIEVSYIPRGFIPGLSVSLLCLMGVLLYAVFAVRSKRLPKPNSVAALP